MAGGGMTATRIVSLGQKARAMKMPPAAKAIQRLVAPVAADNPTLLAEVSTAAPPRKPPAKTLTASAKSPLPTLLTSASRQSSSLIFWQVIRLPKDFRLAHKDTIKNGTTRDQSKAKLNTALPGRAGRTRGPARPAANRPGP